MEARAVKVAAVVTFGLRPGPYLTGSGRPDSMVEMSELIDLHAHTLHSDGSATPDELVRLAAAAGARAIAITDHDTVGGLAEGRSAARKAGIEFVDGIEISAEYAPGTMHILGYYLDDSCTSLDRSLKELRNARDNRNPEIAKRLGALGVELTYEEVARLAGNEVVGRPHFARLMIEKGYARDIQDAFDRFLGKGAPAYVEKKRLSPEASIGLIHGAGGVAVLAHPHQLKLPSMDAAEEVIAGLARIGLDGVEALYSRHTESQRLGFAEIARRHGLLVTGGSDFHGTYKPDICLVRGLGDLEVPYGLLESLKAARRVRAFPRDGVEGPAGRKHEE
jgi:predicted metal-dependent phosphoesterase TrpH